MHHIHNLSFFSEYIRSFGYLAPAVALILFVIQAAVPVFPYAVLVATAVILFGGKIGFLISMLGAILGSVVCYWLCRCLGAEWFNRVLLKRFGYDTSKIKPDIAFWGIVIAHLVPVFPSSMITAAAALSQVSFRSFVVSSALGLIPATLAYTGLGLFLFHVHDVNKALFATGIILLAFFLIKSRFKNSVAPAQSSLAEKEIQ